MRKTFIKNNILPYEELMSLSDEKCVNVNRTYFHYLMAKGTLLEIKDQDYYVIFNKYLEIDMMVDFVKGFVTTTPYFLMSVSDIKYLLTLMKDTPKSKTAFMKSEVSVQELNNRHNKIRKQFLDKKKLDINYNEENIEDVRKSIEENKTVNEQGKAWRMVENPGVPCDVQISETSRKTLAKSLLK